LINNQKPIFKTNHIASEEEKNGKEKEQELKECDDLPVSRVCIDARFSSISKSRRINLIRESSILKVEEYDDSDILLYLLIFCGMMDLLFPSGSSEPFENGSRKVDS
jgi:hypothetical protein